MAEMTSCTKKHGHFEDPFAKRRTFHQYNSQYYLEERNLSPITIRTYSTVDKTGGSVGATVAKHLICTEFRIARIGRLKCFEATPVVCRMA